MLVPLGDDDVCILINDSLDLLEVTGLDAHPLHMDMQRVMLPTVEEERESEESEYFWHNVFCYQLLLAKIGIIFNTHKRY